MSADRQRLKSAIRAIALTPEERRALLGEGQNKGSKPRATGVGVSDAERDRICCDGSTSGSANPGTDEREVGDSQSGLDSNDPADIGGGDGTLSGVTDCATGEPICFDGAGFIPPDGWDAPDDPPIEAGYEEGVYWHVASRKSSTAALSPQGAADKYDGPFPPYCAKVCDVCASGWTLYDSASGGDCGRWLGETSLRSESCANSYEPVCDEPPPTAEAWPSDGCVNLAIKGGKIVGSKYDPENDGSYSSPRDSIELCSGDDQISLAPAANGGFKTINPTTDNGYLYNNKNERIAHIDGNEYSDPSV